MKRTIVNVLTKPWAAPIFSPLIRGTGTVFMFHRFADRDIGNSGHDVTQLRKQLAALRRSRRQVVSIDDLVRRVRDEGLGRTSPIAFTVDDGYADFATVAAPIFAEFDYPVTVFLVSGALDGETWFWWDRITAAFEQTSHVELELTVDGRPLRLDLSNDENRSRAAADLMESLKLINNAERLAVLDDLSPRLDVNLSGSPPRRFAPMSWSDVRDCARRGATFGAHTVSHPILSRISLEAAREEIATSWRRLKEETTAVSHVFCYPNGRPQDITDREPFVLKQLSFAAAVTTIPGHVTDSSYHAHADEGAFRLPRFSYSDVAEDFGQITSGIERAKLAIRALR